MISEISLYQILIVFISLILFLRTVLLFLRGKKSIREVLLAFIIWGSFGLLSFFPNLIAIFGQILGFQIGANAIFTISIIILFYFCLRFYLRLDRIESNITKQTRNLALEKLKSEKR